MKRQIETTLDALNSNDALKTKQITVGFDGCADSIYKAVKKRSAERIEYFSTIAEFGEYISEKNGISCSIELEEVMRKPGGNCAIFADAISTLGTKTSAVGLFGKRQINNEFHKLAESCELFSFGENQFALALEFSNGKVMLAPGVKLGSDAWSSIRTSVGEDNLNRVFLEADMLALLNWSELEFSTQVWNSLYELLKSAPCKAKQIIIDLSDCSRNTKEEIDEMLVILDGFRKIRTVILSLNDNEAFKLEKYFMLSLKDTRSIGEALSEKIGVQILVIHSAKACYTFENGEAFITPTQFNTEPKLLTGGGDNFNAGYTMGRLLGLDSFGCNILGNSVSSFYIYHGKSPTLPQLKEHIKIWHKSLI